MFQSPSPISCVARRCWIQVHFTISQERTDENFRHHVRLRMMRFLHGSWSTFSSPIPLFFAVSTLCSMFLLRIFSFRNFDELVSHRARVLQFSQHQKSEGVLLFHDFLMALMKESRSIDSACVSNHVLWRFTLGSQLLCSNHSASCWANPACFSPCWDTNDLLGFQSAIHSSAKAHICMAFGRENSQGIRRRFQFSLACGVDSCALLNSQGNFFFNLGISIRLDY